MSSAQRYVIVGLGSMGRRHLANLRHLRPQSRIAALRQSRRKGADLPPGCDGVLHSIHEALSFEPAAAIIASPAPFHVDAAYQFVSAGIPVLIEKPLSDKLDDAVALAQFVATGAVPALIGYNLRFEPSLRKLHQLLLNGEAGEVILARGYVGQYLPDWRPQQDYRRCVSARRDLGGGALLELSHEIDLLCWFLGTPSLVSCRGGHYSKLEIDVEDLVELTLEFSDPARLATIGLNFLERAPKRTFSLVGSQATLTWDGIARRVTVDRGGGKEPRVFDFADVDRNASYLAELQHFLSCVEDGSAPAIGLNDGCVVLSVIEAARRAMCTGTTVQLQKEV